MSIVFSRLFAGLSRAVMAAMLGIALAGCSDALPLIAELPHPPLPDVLKVVKSLDRPANVIERGLSNGPKRIEAGEAECLKRALADDHTKVPQLIALMQGCRQGAICHYDYRTVDLVGFVPATSSKFVVNWRAEFDVRKRSEDGAAVPVTVKQF